MTPAVIVGQLVAGASRGSSGVGPVVIAVGLTIGSALLLTFVISKLPGSNENTGASPFRWPFRRDPFRNRPGDPDDQPPRGPFVN